MLDFDVIKVDEGGFGYAQDLVSLGYVNRQRF